MKVPSKNTYALIKEITDYNPVFIAFALILLTISGLLEGISIIAVLPVLSLVMKNNNIDQSQPPNIFEEYMASFLSTIGLEANIVTLLFLIVLGMFLKGVLLFIAQNIMAKAAVNYAAEKREELIYALTKCHWPYFVQKSTGILSAVLTTEANYLSAAYMAVITFYSLVLQVLVYIVIAYFLSWEILFASIFVGGFIIVLLKGVVKSTRKQGRIQVISMQNLNNKLIDGLRILKPLKAMAREERIVPYLKQNVHDLKESNYKSNILTNFVRLSQEPIMTVFLAIGIYWIFTYQSLDMATLLFMVLIYYRMVTRIGVIQSAVQKISGQQDSFWSVLDTIKETKEKAEVSFSNSDDKISFKEKITIKDLSFAYGDNQVLNNINLEIPAKKFVSFIGPSGMGKTTLMELLIGLNMPNSGAIFIDGKNISDLNIKNWRHNIGFVPQEIVLTNDTIYNNVTLYDDKIDQKEVIKALEQAQAWDFIKELPEGLNTMAGEHGARFSGGQRQRISIARALVHNPDVIILDEPTTALDPETEEDICKTLKELSKKRTVIAISHQKRIADYSDTIFKMQDL